MKSAFNTILMAYTAAFISVIPYIILMASIILLSNILPILNIDVAAIPLLNVESLRLVRTVLAEFFYFVLLIAIAHQLAKSYGISQTAVIFQSIAIYIATEALAHAHGGLDAVLSANSPFLVLIIPFLVVQAIGYFTPAGKTSYQYVGAELNTSFRNIYSGIINFALIVGLLLVLEVLLELVTAASGAFRPSLPNEAVLLFRTLLVGYLFWFGLHGTHIYDALFGVDHYVDFLFPGLTLNQFYNTFVVYGGVGATLSLIIAILIASKDQHSRRIARLALPFSLFNINEVLIYGLPIVFNRKLLLPFLLVPLINSILAYAFLSAFKVPMNDIEISWITPVFINSYLLTQGSLAALALQALLLGLGALVYLPFIRGYTLERSGGYQSTRLSQELNVPFLFKSEPDIEAPKEDYTGEKTVLFKLKSGQDIEAQKAQRSIIQDNEEVDKAINLLETATLMVYYQPKVNIREGVCRQFEALLRIRMPEGEVRGPFFLPPLEKAGLEPIIDLWVCQQVNTHLRAWKTTPLPEISINLHPDTLARADVIEKIIAIHQGNPVGFEIIERGLFDNIHSFDNIQKLKASGFKILIDDFGVGAASMENLCYIPVDTLKIDKSLADLLLTKKGYIVCKNIVALCQDMNLDCVIEGIESEAQMQAAAKLGIPIIQGFFFSEAISKNEAENLRQPRRYDLPASK